VTLHRNWNQRSREGPSGQPTKTMFEKAEVAWVSLSIFRRPLICRTVQISYKYVHVLVLPSYCAVRRFLSLSSPLKQIKNPLYCAPSLTNSPILLSIALSSRPVLPKSLAPAAHVVLFPLAPRSQSPATRDALPRRQNSPESSSTFSRPNS
jgi:hypothetical protein